MAIEYLEEEPVIKKHKVKLLIFGIFLAILSFLIYTSFPGNFPLTGNIIKHELNLNNSIAISTDLTIPVLFLDGEFENVNIKGNSDSFFYVGDEKLSLSNLRDNYIVLKDYEGEISFNEKSITKLKGKVTKVFFNGVPITSKSDDKMKIYFDTDFKYDILDIEKEVFIKKLDYETSGTVILDEKTTIDLENDNLVIKKFYGDVKIENKHFKIQGYLENLDIKGNQQISVSA